jgi:hypothetical protein
MIIPSGPRCGKDIMWACSSACNGAQQRTHTSPMEASATPQGSSNRHPLAGAARPAILLHRQGHLSLGSRSEAPKDGMIRLEHEPMLGNADP